MKDKISLNNWILICSIGVLIFLMNVDYTAVSLTFMPISKELGEDLNNLQWLLSGYTLIWASFVIPGGRIADIYGKRTALLWGVAIFILSSAFIGLSSKIEYLIAGRVIQGIGAAIFTAPCWAVIFSSAPPSKQGLVMGVALTFSGIGLSVGPTLAGYLIEVLNWRWIFYANVPIGIFVMLSFLAIMKPDSKNHDVSKIDLLGTALLSSGLCCAVFALNQIEIWGFGVKLCATLAVGIVLIALFLVRDSKRDVRMIPLSLIRNKAFICCSGNIFFVAMTFSLMLVLIGLYLQKIKGYSSYEAGLVFFAMTVSMGALSPFGGNIVDRFGVRKPLFAATIMLMISTILMSCLTSDSHILLICTALFFGGTGIGCFFTAGNIAMMRSVPMGDLNVASGVYTMWMMLGNTLSIIMYSSLFVLFAQQRLFELLYASGITLTDEAKRILAEKLGRVGEQIVGTPGITDQIASFMVEGMSFGFSLNMWIGTAMLGVVFMLVKIGTRRLDKHTTAEDKGVPQHVIV